ncbi:methylated-DNA--[protein]-cysteine S-methyltransferase [Rheinheimera sp. MMS21-TC3]|uniref:methylated-DNA--[protein]-cysteine S-methyltransferase n=1 Tax=Rheinheimera sp. MMS21-TC3 TaxID=3072790 RepID=UPI0028C4A9B0|nr:methylated-DNA--[protein]-cysteine S-methyltransferase [Rheinheimera sp. MMS21-TC3]WNO62043.1 methylated-DNA--[protein]-cysteine S-methyltransferase [Rheinheimera sp. MMS21-TC3]
MYRQYIDTPLGLMRISASELGITEANFILASEQKSAQASAITQQAAQQLTAYFAGKLQQFTLPLAATGTEFQQQVWQQLTRIPFATTCSYAAIAQQIGRPKAMRAVGAANGRNPIAIIVPCHRVIGASGKLTGYAGGLDKKAWLLKHEQHL